ncbi:cold-shock protein [Myroides odoratimimus]|uniref:cold-shock protein n=1 Tax=Myroides odoratimimus TaxID=76832 RepID=UPI002574FADF|nr:cold shock domain-containing protein [Myroides odoratimimus]MDM1454886.1 cold shock domain-containing protein [Myroides odoratimimus]MDM1478617.1 cold shock domain-containing protein [Myroides odoratimimus]MDM1490953.1 cold shock domain-containing protein [Myroides odoratimimus]
MQEGTVKFFNETKGFGFITNGNEDIFVHATGLEEDIKQGDNVTYNVEKGQKGFNAINVGSVTQTVSVSIS